MRRILADPSVTSARLVVNPERMVIAEARRTYTYLSLFGYHVDAVIVNRVLPDGGLGPVVRHVAGDPDRAPGHHRGRASPRCPCCRPAWPRRRWWAWTPSGPWPGTCGAGSIRPGAWSAGRPLRVDQEGDDLVLTVELPFAERGEVDVSRSGDDLLITLGPHRRSLVLPDSLRRREVGSAALADGALRVVFTERS